MARKVKTKEEKIKEIVSDILSSSQNAMMFNLEKLFKSGAIDVDSWEENHNPMILPKCIVTALLEQEATQYLCKGTSFEKEIKKEVANIRYFI